MESVMVSDIMDTLEAHGMLLRHHYGGRVGRCITDPVLQLTQTIRDAWRVGKVMSVLYLDIS